MKFFETQAEQDLFALQLSQLIGALQEIAAALKQPAAPDRQPEQEPAGAKTDILSDIYYCDYIPESMMRRENDPCDKNAKKAANALMETLSPEQRELFFQYESAENTRGSSIACRAYKDGIRLAVQIFMAARPFRPQEQQP